jgi:hypothetical protein
MNNGRSNANLQEELEGRQMALRYLVNTGGREDYRNLQRNQIRGIQHELARRARNQAVTKRRTRLARKALRTWKARSYRPPTNNGGESYRRLLRTTAVGKR